MASRTDKQSDEALLTAWGSGDADAGNAFIERHFVSVYRFFSTKVAAEADDLTQQTFSDLQRAVARLGTLDSGRAYVMKIARNRLYMFLRSRAVKDRVFDPRVMSIAAVEPGPSPSGALARRGPSRALLEALRAVPLEAQVVHELYYWEELPVKDIAEVIGVQPGTVMSRLFRARKKVNEALEAATGDARLAASTMAGLDTWAAGVRGDVLEDTG